MFKIFKEFLQNRIINYPWIIYKTLAIGKREAFYFLELIDLTKEKKIYFMLTC